MMTYVKFWRVTGENHDSENAQTLKFMNKRKLQKKNNMSSLLPAFEVLRYQMPPTAAHTSL